MRLIIIAALDENRIIGKGNTIPWHNKEDFQHFKTTTLGHPVIMGRKTCESLKKPLSNRVNIVVTRNMEFVSSGFMIVHSLEEALCVARKHDSEKSFVIGGAEMYKQALPLADEMLLSFISGKHEGDTYFPQWGNAWKVVEEKQMMTFTLKLFKRKE